MDVRSRTDAGGPSLRDLNPSVWKSYMREAAPADRSMVDRWRVAMEGLLIFAGLFSAILTAFIIDTYKQLKPDNGDLTVLYLIQISQQLSALNNTTQPLPSTPLDSISLSPDPGIITANLFWFLSLGCSLICAVAATLVQQWARGYIHHIQRRPRLEDQAHVRAFLFEGVEKYHMNAIVDGIPLLMHVALFLFLIGLFYFTKSVHPDLHLTAMVILIALGALYLCASVIPIFSFSAPIQTPLTSALWHLKPFRRVILLLHAFIIQPISRSLSFATQRTISFIGKLFSLSVCWPASWFLVHEQHPSALPVVRGTEPLDVPVGGNSGILFPQIAHAWNSHRSLDEERQWLALQPTNEYSKRSTQCLAWTASCLTDLHELLEFHEALPTLMRNLFHPHHYHDPDPERFTILQSTLEGINIIGSCTNLLAAVEPDTDPGMKEQVIEAVADCLWTIHASEFEFVLDTGRLFVPRKDNLSLFSPFRDLLRKLHQPALAGSNSVILLPPLIILTWILRQKQGGYPIHFLDLDVEGIKWHFQKHTFPSDTPSDALRVADWNQCIVAGAQSLNYLKVPSSESLNSSNQFDEALEFALLFALGNMMIAVYQAPTSCAILNGRIARTLDKFYRALYQSHSLHPSTKLRKMYSSVFALVTKLMLHFPAQRASVTESFLFFIDQQEAHRALVNRMDIDTLIRRVNHWLEPSYISILHTYIIETLEYSMTEDDISASDTYSPPKLHLEDLSLLPTQAQLSVIDKMESYLRQHPQFTRLDGKNPVYCSCAQTLWQLANTLKEPRCLIEVKTRVLPLFTGTENYVMNSVAPWPDGQVLTPAYEKVTFLGAEAPGHDDTLTAQ